MTIRFVAFLALAFVICAAFQCRKDTVQNSCFKGKLAIKGMCGNYTVQLLQGSLDTTSIEANWQDEVTGKTYTNVFALGNPCSFPDSIKQGNEFYFTLGSEPQNCLLCLAYYPKPKKSLSIKVLDKPCQ
ncbi:hypothetical protein [Flavisolibacter ginsenosidimutans]|uniref:Uncharacterized protein n=1 Tax=Flavisolibacter ginsenosidimutans TaxID=661481 RepID=A0A5B8UFM8_9BACT|nr:hypothetical protein [Flavisolibacter ginsenosidimutans]QEC55374.1 hypothetical protein FSB75_05460 [Flavisolibacter ginsenosidimutans]